MGLLGGEVGEDDGAGDDQEGDEVAHDGGLGFGVGPGGELPEGRDGLEVLAVGRERALEAAQVAGEVDVGARAEVHGELWVGRSGDRIDEVTLVTGSEEARQALLMQGLVVLVGFTGVIAQVVAMLGGGGLNDAGKDLAERLRVLAVPSGVGPDVGEVGFGDVEEDLHGVEVVKGLLGKGTGWKAYATR